MILILLKTFILYALIVLIYKIIGTKEVVKLDVVDLITAILIAFLATASLISSNVSLASAVPAIITLMGIQIIKNYLLLKNIKIRKFLDSDRTVIIKNGKLMFREISNLHYSLEDLITQLREQGIKSIDAVECAVLGNNGKIAIRSLNSNYPLPLIIDGTIDKFGLSEIGKNEKWLYRLLKQKEIEIADVFYALYIGNKTFIIRKSEL